MSGVTVELLIIVLLILTNGLLSMAETAIVSARKTRLEQLADEKHPGARAALDLAKNPTRFLSTTQIGITLVGILAGAFGGATLAGHLASALAEVRPLKPYSDGLAIGVVVLIITLLSLIFGELVPNRLALNNPERTASLMARPMNALSVVTAPAVHLVSAATDLVLRLGGLKASVEPPITEEEIKILLEHGTQAGIFEETEQDMVKSIFNLDQRRVEELMTPRPKVVWIDIDDPLEESCKTMVASGFSYYPVYKDTPDNILGTVSVKDLWARMVSNEPVDLKALVQKPFFVPETIPALEMLERFRESRQHIALVLNEYGGVDGVLTLMDLLEAIVGDLPSLHELSEAGPVRREDGSWLLDGMMAADELKELFNLDKLPGEDDNLYSTLGGFVVMHLERIPTTGDHFESAGLRFEVVDMDGKRVDKVMVTQPAPPLSDVEH